MKAEIRFYVGGQKDANGNDIPMEQLRGFELLAQRCLIETYEGYTAYRHNGGWFDDDKRPTEEEGITYVVVTSAVDDSSISATARRVAKRLANIFHQYCVLYTITEVKAGLVKGG